MEGQLGTSLIATLSKSDLPEALGNLSEVAFDSILTDGVLKDIPVIGTLISLGKAAGSVRNYFFAKKMLIFLNSMASLPLEERDSLVKKLDADENFRGSVGETIIELIARIDGEIKPLCVAIAFKHYAQETIDATELVRLNNAIARFMFCDFEKLNMLCDAIDPFSGPDDPAASNLINAGLCFTASGYNEGIVQPNSLCPKFRNIVKEAKS